jgi:hypothetical protein
MTLVPIPPDAPKLSKGNRIRVTQLIIGRDLRWTTSVEGVVESYRPEPTGSWFAPGKDDKLWLLRLRLRKADGELTTLTLDARSKVEMLTS